MLITALIIVSEAKAFEYKWVKKIEKKSHVLACIHPMTEIFFFLKSCLESVCLFVCVAWVYFKKLALLSSLLALSQK